MAKLRQNHTRNGKNPFAGMMVKLFVVIGILALLFIMAYNFLTGRDFQDLTDSASIEMLDDDSSSSSYSASVGALIPEGYKGEIVKHTYYTLGYNESHEQSDWVSYELTKESLQIPNVPRAKRFNTDPDVSSRSARHNDYSNSGYTRGHMAPAGDMAFSEEAMQETFYMSNMSPQLRAFNGGIWRELEETVRDWAYRENKIYIVSGPIFDGVTKYIGKSSKVRVPTHFYKLIVDLSGRSKKGIGFLIPHAMSEAPLMDYAVSIDEIEAKTGLDFFDQLYENSEEEDSVEMSIDKGAWPMSNKRYNNRVKHWNKN